MPGSGRYYENKWVGEWDSVVKKDNLTCKFWRKKQTENDMCKDLRSMHAWQIQRIAKRPVCLEQVSIREVAAEFRKTVMALKTMVRTPDWILCDLGGLWKVFGKTDTIWFVFWKKNSSKWILKCGAGGGNSGNRKNSRSTWGGDKRGLIICQWV